MLAALVIGAAGWLSWRRPTILLAVTLASLSVRPQLFAGGASVGYEWGLHHTLLLRALVANALRFGLRRTMYWPVAGLLAEDVLVLSTGLATFAYLSVLLTRRSAIAGLAHAGKRHRRRSLRRALREGIALGRVRTRNGSGV